MDGQITREEYTWNIVFREYISGLSEQIFIELTDSSSCTYVMQLSSLGVIQGDGRRREWWTEKDIVL